MHCTEASHWKCLTPVQQHDILRSTREREQAASGTSETVQERQAIRYDESTGYICNYCSQKEFCLACQRELESPLFDEDVHQDKTTQTDAVEGNAITTLLISEQLIFRCVECKGAAHYAHLPSPFKKENGDDPFLIDDIALHYQNEYQWRCDVCSDHDSTVDKIIAWRPYPPNAPLLTATEVEERSLKEPWPREYLVKWSNKSYRRTSWVPHLWLISTTYLKLRHFILHGPKVRLEHLRSVAEGDSPRRNATQEEKIARRKAFEDEDGPPLPNPRAEECIPDPWKRIEQVLDVRFLAPYKLNKRKGKGKRVVESSDEHEEDEEAEEKISKALDALCERSRVSGVLFLDKNALETPAERRQRKGGVQIEDEDIDDVVWCLTKWGELEYQEGQFN
jgi:chromodomain-helicase-DNA-binding protein 4